jgi:hypothetical protein
LEVTEAVIAAVDERPLEVSLVNAIELGDRETVKLATLSSVGNTTA